MSKLVVMSAKDMVLKTKSMNTAVNKTKGVLRAHAKVLNYATKIENMERGLGRKVKAILAAFENYNKAVIKRLGKTNLTAVDVVTPAVKAEILLPYLEFLSSMGGSKSIQQAIDFLNSKRKKELDTYGKTEQTASEINRLYDLQIEKFVLPLRVIEAQFNSLDYLKKPKGKYSTFSNAVNKVLSAPEAVTDVTPEPEKAQEPETQTIG